MYSLHSTYTRRQFYLCIIFYYRELDNKDKERFILVTLKEAEFEGCRRLWLTVVVVVVERTVRKYASLVLVCCCRSLILVIIILNCRCPTTANYTISNKAKNLHPSCHHLQRCYCYHLSPLLQLRLPTPI